LNGPSNRTVFSNSGALFIGLLAACGNTPVPASAPVHPHARPAALRDEYAQAFEIPASMRTQLASWGALPSWASSAKASRDDWLASFHANVTAAGWPVAVQQIEAHLLDHHPDFATSRSWGPSSAIFIPATAPPFLTELAQSVFTVLTPPDSDDPNAKMNLDPSKFDEAGARISRAIWMLRETGYVDARDSAMDRSPIIVFGLRFIYYHELSHGLVRAGLLNSSPTWILDQERYLAEELVADQSALSVLGVEVRHHPELQGDAMAGLAFAMGLAALRELSADHGDNILRAKDATLRMSRLLYWLQIAADQELVTKESVAMAQGIWDILRELFRHLTGLSSPVEALLNFARDGGDKEWVLARNHIVRWIAFGDRCRVFSALQRERNRRCQAPDGGRERGITFLEYLCEQTRNIEPELKLRAALGDCGSITTLYECRL
jgi:hypothetical protein